MATKRHFSEAETLERYRVALENVEDQKEIAEIMAEFGYNSKIVSEGKQLFESTRKAYDFNKQEDDETSEVYSSFKSKQEELDEIYSLHRKKAKVVFRNEPEVLKRLNLDGSMPQAYVKWFETVKKFYKEVLADKQIQNKLARLKITLEELTNTDNKITELDAARAEYLKERGESQDATKQKDAVFAQIDDWMSEFYAVARIALEDNPQLLEALGLFVRS
jgi:hypothetical protein